MRQKQDPATAHRATPNPSGRRRCDVVDGEPARLEREARIDARVAALVRGDLAEYQRLKDD